MIMSSRGKRSALTLLEVLITIFVMGIGMLAVLTLFPLAAKKISAAIDMDRATQMAANAAALAELRKITSTVDTVISSQIPGSPNNSKPSDIYLFDESGEQGGAYKPGRSLSFFKRQAWSISFSRDLCVSPDEYPFTDSGIPEAGSRRGERYSAAYMYRRQRWDDSKSLQLVILVFAGRAVEFANRFDFDLAPAPPGAFPISGGIDQITIKDPSSNSAADLPQPDRVISRGSWLMDASTDRWKRFYKVVAVDSSVKNQLTITLDRQLEDPDSIPGNADDRIDRLLWLDYMVDWFDRGSVQ
jgi:Tfp pilus assembly protein PilV